MPLKSACVIALVALSILMLSGGDALAEISKTTYVYKTIANDLPFTGVTEIHADVYRTPVDKPMPVLVFMHGGGLMNGNRNQVKFDLDKFCAENGFILVSLDYRLGPEVKVQQIAEDVRDAMAWIREKGPELFGADTSRIVLTGSSAGSYLSLLAGTWEPKPLAICSFWGYGNIMADWYTKPKSPYKEMDVDQEAALAEVNNKVLTGTGNGSDVPARKQYGNFVRKYGYWTEVMTGVDYQKEPEKIAPYCPVMNVTADYPPTMLICGELDSDVPCYESINMAAALKEKGVPHELIVVPGAEHGLAGVPDEVTDPVFARAKAFIKQHLTKEAPGAE
jgi:acetyl esterase/lipase